MEEAINFYANQLIRDSSQLQGPHHQRQSQVSGCMDVDEVNSQQFSFFDKKAEGQGPAEARWRSCRRWYNYHQVDCRNIVGNHRGNFHVCGEEIGQLGPVSHDEVVEIIKLPETWASRNEVMLRSIHVLREVSMAVRTLPTRTSATT